VVITAEEVGFGAFWGFKSHQFLSTQSIYLSVLLSLTSTKNDTNLDNQFQLCCVGHEFLGSNRSREGGNLSQSR